MYNLSVILPVYNERFTIGSILSEWIKQLNKYNLKYQFLICEDGSTDGTKEFLQKLKKNYPLLILTHKERLGYGGAIINGIRSSHSDYILCVDSDGQYDPS